MIRHLRLPGRIFWLTIVAAFGLGAARVGAECGDYLMLAGKHRADAHEGAAPPPGLPCHGPQCSQRPETPIAPPISVPIQLSTKDQGLPSGARDLSDGSAEFSHPSSSLGRPIRRPGSIFHPPRVEA